MLVAARTQTCRFPSADATPETPAPAGRDPRSALIAHWGPFLATKRDRIPARRGGGSASDRPLTLLPAIHLTLDAYRAVGTNTLMAHAAGSVWCIPALSGRHCSQIRNPTVPPPAHTNSAPRSDACRGAPCATASPETARCDRPTGPSRRSLFTRCRWWHESALTACASGLVQAWRRVAPSSRGYYAGHE
jgi:hypothetical protein